MKLSRTFFFAAIATSIFAANAQQTVPVPGDNSTRAGSSGAKVAINFNQLKTDVTNIVNSGGGGGGVKKTYTSDGTFTVPMGVSEVRLYGSGGGGSSGSSGGDCGMPGYPGEALNGAPVAVTAGQVIPVTIGKGGPGVKPWEGYHNYVESYCRHVSGDGWTCTPVWSVNGCMKFNADGSCYGTGTATKFGSLATMAGGFIGESADTSGGQCAAGSQFQSAKYNANVHTYSGIIGQGLTPGKGGNLTGGSWVQGNPGTDGFLIVEYTVDYSGQINDLQAQIDALKANGGSGLSWSQWLGSASNTSVSKTYRGAAGSYYVDTSGNFVREDTGENLGKAVGDAPLYICIVDLTGMGQVTSVRQQFSCWTSGTGTEYAFIPYFNASGKLQSWTGALRTWNQR